MRYIEIGIGNRWLVRTEIENDDGSETEIKGIIKPFIINSLYLRIWIRYTVVIIDSKSGIIINKKPRKAFKLILGFSGN